MAQMDDFDDLDDLGSLDDFDDLEGLTLEDDPPSPQQPVAPPQATPAAAVPAAPPSAPAAPLSGLGTVIQDLMAKRNFAQIVQIAESQKEALAQDPQALAMVQSAQGFLESENYVLSFLKAAAAARDSGDVAAMEEQLAKARALDAGHPAIAAFSTTAPTTAAAPPAIGAPPPAAPAPASPVIAAPPPAAAIPSAATPPAAPTVAADDDFLSFSETPTPSADDGLLDLSLEPSAEEMAEPELDSLEMSFEELDDVDDVPATTATPATPAMPSSPAIPVEPAVDMSALSEDADTEVADGGDRIQKLLAEGKEMFDQGEYQSSIDIWSRIFLIDIDNTEASRLIEEARSKKAELERQAEELFHQGADHIEQQQLEEAKAAFRQVLEIDASHSLAREYLEQLEAGQVPTLARGGEAEILTPPDGLEDGALADDGDRQSMEAAVQRDRIVVTKKMDRRLIALGALVAILVVGGGTFLAMKWDDLFPNQQDVATAPARRTDPIEKATQLHTEGKTDEAIRLLETIVDSDPVFQEAGALIAQWRAEAEAPPEDVATGPSQEQLARYNLLLQAARQAQAEQRFIRAQKYFDAASKIAPVEGEDAVLLTATNEALAPLVKEIEMFEKAEYERLIPSLWLRREKEPNNPDLDLLLVDSYYNLALTDLQRGDALGAAEKLKDALQVQPDSRELQRLELFARTYSSRPTDLLYRIFVKYLPSRS